jgi:hypothetical protein
MKALSEKGASGKTIANNVVRTPIDRLVLGGPIS